MSSKTKIVVLHMKEIIYTAIFLILGLILAGILFFMFCSGGQKEKETGAYIPGIYTSSVTLNNTELLVEVAVNDDAQISSVRLSNLDDTVLAMYPLLSPAIESLSDQICSTQSLEDIALPEENPYTSKLLLNAVEEALKNAVAP